MEVINPIEKTPILDISSPDTLMSDSSDAEFLELEEIAIRLLGKFGLQKKQTHKPKRNPSQPYVLKLKKTFDTCSQCGINLKNTPLARKITYNGLTLNACNACGIRWKRSSRKQTTNAVNDDSKFAESTKGAALAPSFSGKHAQHHNKEMQTPTNTASPKKITYETELVLTPAIKFVNNNEYVMTGKKSEYIFY